MNRKYLYYIISGIIYALSVWIIGKYFINDFLGPLVCGVPCIGIGFLIGAIIDTYISLQYPSFLYTPFNDLRKYAGFPLHGARYRAAKPGERARF